MIWKRKKRQPTETADTQGRGLQGGGDRAAASPTARSTPLALATPTAPTTPTTPTTLVWSIAKHKSRDHAVDLGIEHAIWQYTATGEMYSG